MNKIAIWLWEKLSRLHPREVGVEAVIRDDVGNSPHFGEIANTVARQIGDAFDRRIYQGKAFPPNIRQVDITRERYLLLRKWHYHIVFSILTNTGWRKIIPMPLCLRWQQQEQLMKFIPKLEKKVVNALLQEMRSN